MSPTKKKVKINNVESNNKGVEIQARKRKNFITACEQVSFRVYFDHRSRFLLAYLPACMKTICSHDQREIHKPKQMPLYAQESFDIDMKRNMWYEALEVCHMYITTTQYLSFDVLKDIVEIMLNAHDDDFTEYSAKQIVDKCQHILMHHFSTHAPCIDRNVRNCYNKFLTSPMVLKENTFTNRDQYECHKGIVKYSLNRLEYELNIDSEDGPLIDEDIPKEMKNSVRGLHWHKEKCEIFELLDRHSRIERLFAVLESVIELLQFDLAIWHSRYTNDLGRHIMRTHKPLMAYVLWSENVLYTGAVTNICRQILRIFTKMLLLNYPDAMIRIITIWLNTMVQTFYICESNANMDYPNTSKYCNVFANDFYKIVSDMPHDSVIRILERIEPSFMRHLIGLLHIKKVLSTNDNCIIEILIKFLRHSHWNSYQCYSSEQKLSNKLFPKAKKTKKKIRYLLKKYINVTYMETLHIENYEKMKNINVKALDFCLNHIVMSLYITLEAYLDAYDIQSVQETWNDLNTRSMNTSSEDNDSLYEHSFYSVTESLIKKYKNILQSTRELVCLFSDLMKRNELPKVFNIFENIDLLELEQ